MLASRAASRVDSAPRAPTRPSRCCHMPGPAATRVRAADRRGRSVLGWRGDPTTRRGRRRHTRGYREARMADSRQLRRLVELQPVGGRADPDRDRRRGARGARPAARGVLRHDRGEPAPHAVAQRNWLARWRGEPPPDQTIDGALARGLRGDARGASRATSPGSPMPTPSGWSATRIFGGTPREIVAGPRDHSRREPRHGAPGGDGTPARAPRALSRRPRLHLLLLPASLSAGPAAGQPPVRGEAKQHPVAPFEDGLAGRASAASSGSRRRVTRRSRPPWRRAAPTASAADWLEAARWRSA